METHGLKSPRAREIAKEAEMSKQQQAQAVGIGSLVSTPIEHRDEIGREYGMIGRVVEINRGWYHVEPSADSAELGLGRKAYRVKDLELMATAEELEAEAAEWEQTREIIRKAEDHNLGTFDGTTQERMVQEMDETTNDDLDLDDGEPIDEAEVDKVTRVYQHYLDLADHQRFDEEFLAAIYSMDQLRQLHKAVETPTEQRLITKAAYIVAAKMEEEDKTRLFFDLSRYEIGLAQTESGRPTVDINDMVADYLRVPSLQVQKGRAATFLRKVRALLEEVEGDAAETMAMEIDIVSYNGLEEKYGHLNPGMQRMNMGNRMRGAVNKLKDIRGGSLTEDDIRALFT